MNLRLGLCAALILSFSLAGCGGSIGGPELGRVTGVVTLDGAPLPDATVMFQPQNGRPSFGTTDSSGKYELGYTQGSAGAVLGENTVFIRTEIPGPDGQPPVQKEKLPAKYHNKTELKANVVPGANTFNFDLTSKK